MSNTSLISITSAPADDPARLRAAIADAARAFALRHGDACAILCRARAGEAGAAVAWAALDMLADGAIHPAAAPLAEVAALLDAHPRPGAARRAFRALVALTETLADAELTTICAATGADQTSPSDAGQPRAA
ncbi:hypothetical protein SAMN05444370_13114 [Rubrimonas cliftonensis]|uniref:Uncharacterized protein n=2 Tax=Rubrimonas cliftonensis TaxID=89524 RepID=A0A1H4FZH5_9RHOB|nr:hypothetical protein SAMN05444370_13114 [Rubrimonas cliftonensis]